MSTPKSMKIVIQLFLLIILTAFSVSTVLLIIGFNRHSNFEKFLFVLKNTYERSIFIGSNRLITRIFANIANGYEHNSDSIIEDRFSTY